MERAARGWNPDHFPLRNWPAFWNGSFGSFSGIGSEPRAGEWPLVTNLRMPEKC
jgi:hypothetical protein